MSAELSRGRAGDCGVAGGFLEHGCAPRGRADLRRSSERRSTDQNGKASPELAGEDESATALTRHEEEGNPYLRGGKARGGEN